MGEKLFLLVLAYFFGVVVGAVIGSSVRKEQACQICEAKEYKCTPLTPQWEREAIKNGWNKPSE